MLANGLAIRAIRRGATHSGPIGRVARSAGFRLCTRLSAQGHSVVEGRLRTGSPIILDVRDPAQRQILLTGETERGTSLLLSRMLRPGWVVVDVGANAGFYSLLAVDLKASRVLAFEPNPATAALLTRSIAGTSVEFVQAACGAEPGTAELYFSPDPGKQAFATIKSEAQWSDDWSAWGSTTVPLVTVDDECSARELAPDFIKIDAEGAELEVMQGMARLLGDRVPQALLCEVAAGWERPDPSPWLDMLHEAGYDGHVVGDDGSLEAFSGPSDKYVQNVCFYRRA